MHPCSPNRLIVDVTYDETVSSLCKKVATLLASGALVGAAYILPSTMGLERRGGDGEMCVLVDESVPRETRLQELCLESGDEVYLTTLAQIPIKSPADYPMHEPASSLSLSSCGRYCAVGLFPGKAQLYDLHLGNCVKSWLGGDCAGTASIVALSKNYVLATMESEVHVFSRESGVKVKVWHGHTAQITSMKYGFGHVVTGGFDKTLRIADLNTKRYVARIEIAETVTSVAISDALCVCGTASGSVVGFSYEGEELMTISDHSKSVTCMSFALSLGLFATGGQEGVVHLYDASFTKLGTLKGHYGSITAVSFPAAAPSVFTSSMDGSIRRWDVASMKCVQKIDRYSPVASLCVSPDGASIIDAGSYSVLRVRAVEVTDSEDDDAF